MNRARNADHAAIKCERIVYSIVKITRLYDYQTWQTFFWEIHELRKGFWVFSWLCFSDADWLGGKLRSQSLKCFSGTSTGTGTGTIYTTSLNYQKDPAKIAATKRKTSSCNTYAITPVQKKPYYLVSMIVDCLSGICLAVWFVSILNFLTLPFVRFTFSTVSAQIICTLLLPVSVAFFFHLGLCGRSTRSPWKGTGTLDKRNQMIECLGMKIAPTRPRR